MDHFRNAAGDAFPFSVGISRHPQTSAPCTPLLYLKIACICHTLNIFHNTTSIYRHHFEPPYTNLHTPPSFCTSIYRHNFTSMCRHHFPTSNVQHKLHIPTSLYIIYILYTTTSIYRHHSTPAIHQHPPSTDITLPSYVDSPA